MKIIDCKGAAWLYSSVSLVLVSLLMLVSTSGASDIRQLWQSRDQFVALEKLEGNVAVNNHPTEISAEKLATILSSIMVKTPDSKTEEKLFTEQSVEVLAPEMSQAFKKANQNQDVVFAIIGLHKSLFGFAKSPKVTTGRAFYKDGRLNVIFGFAQQDFNEREDRRLHPFVPGSREKSLDGEWSIVAQPERNGFNLLRKDWVTISGEWQMPVAQPAAVGRNVPTVQPQLSKPAKPGSDTRNPSERLITLNELKDKGLISEEEYRLKRTEILNGL